MQKVLTTYNVGYTHHTLRLLCWCAFVLCWFAKVSLSVILLRDRVIWFRLSLVAVMMAFYAQTNQWRNTINSPSNFVACF